MMNKIFSLLLLILLSMSIHAQYQEIEYSTPKEYFDEAAKKYISDDKLAAVQILQAGLQKFEDDEEMRALAEELFKDMQKQQQEQQKQQEEEQEKQEDNEQNKQEQEQQDQQDKEEGDQGEEKEEGDQGEEKEGENGDEKKEGDEGKEGDENKEEKGENEGDESDKQDGEEGEDGEPKSDEEGEQGEQEEAAKQGQAGEGKPGDEHGQQMVPMGISKQDAERILKAVNNSEKKVQAKVIKKKAKSTGKGKTEKDW